MKLRTIINSILAVGTISLSSLALASPSLTIHNNTDFPSTVVTNDNACSSGIPNGEGVTPKHDSRTIDGKKVRAACILNTKRCKADVYLSDNCTGAVIATAYFDVDTGLIGDPESKPGSEYCVRKNQSFEVTIDKC